MEELYTEYTLSINNEYKFKDIYDLAMESSAIFKKDFPGEVTILNDLY